MKQEVKPRVPRADSADEPSDPVAASWRPGANGRLMPRPRVSLVLFGLVVAVLLPALGIGVIASAFAVREERAAAEGRLRDAAQALALAMDRQISTYLSALGALAAAPTFSPHTFSPPTLDSSAPDRQSPDAPDTPLHAYVDRVASQLGTTIFILAPDGRLLMTTYPRPRAASLSPEISARLRRIVASGLPAVGNLMVGSMSGRLVVPMGTPVLDAHNHVSAVIFGGVELIRLHRLLQQGRLPAHAVATIVDANGIIVGRSDPAWNRLVDQPVTEAGWPPDAGAMQGWRRVTGSDGITRVWAFQSITAAPGWIVGVSQPAASFDAAWQRPLATLTFGGLAALLLSLALAAIAARRLVGPLQDLAGHARAIVLAGGEPLAAGTTAAALPPAGIAELETMRRAFAAAEDAYHRRLQAERRALAALADQETQLQTLLDTIPIGTAKIDFEGGLLRANDAMLTILGVTREAFETGDLRWTGFTAPGSEGITERAIAEALASPYHRCAPYKKELLRADGTRVPVLISFVLTDLTHHVAAGFVIDLTELQRNETRLAASEARLRALLAAITEGIIVVAADGRITAANPAAIRMFGFETEEAMIGHPVVSLITTDDPRRRDELLARLREPGSGHEVAIRGGELTGRRSDGSQFPFELSVSTFLVNGVRSYTGVARDVTERKAAEAAIRDSEARFRMATEAGQIGIFDWDLETDRHYWDARVSALWGVIAGHPVSTAEFLAAVHPNDAASLRAALANAIDPSGDGVYMAEYRVRDPDGVERYIAARGRTTFDNGRPLRLVGVAVDLTRQRQAEMILKRDKEELERLVAARTRDLEQTQNRLAHAQRMEALGRLAGGIAHDFNNVLQAINGSVTLAAKRLRADPDKAERFLRLASDAAERGAGVTNRLLAFARRGELSAGPVAAEPLLHNLADLLSPTLRPGVHLSVSVEPDTPDLFADASQLETVLMNLISNAADALSDCGGEIRLAAQADAAPMEPPPELKPGAYVRITVADTGSGMPPEVLARVTEPFFTTKPKGKGTGLGLAMARGFAEQSGGALLVESNLGAGTTVSLWLPISPTPGTVIQAPRSPGVAVAPAQSSKRILVVDDEPMVRQVVAGMLIDRGLDVTVAEDASAALAALRGGLSPDLLVTDLAMPGDMDGLALIAATRLLYPGLPAIVITGHTGDAAEDALRQVAASGPFAMLHKPISAEALTERLTALVP